MTDSDDDIPQLSVHAAAALKEFYSEQLTMQNKEEKDIKEDWQLSQFWYDEHTANVLALEVIRAVGPNGRVACLSTPTIYKKLRELKPDSLTAHLFEYDRRFDIYGKDFFFYDYNTPLRGVDGIIKCSYDIVIVDPPFLSEECLQKTSETIQYLAESKIILCTGAVMENLAAKLLKVYPSTFKPGHANNLANEILFSQASRLQLCLSQHLCDDVSDMNPKNAPKKLKASKRIEKLLHDIKDNAISELESERILNLAKPKSQIDKAILHHKKIVNDKVNSSVPEDIISAVKDVAATFKNRNMKVETESNKPRTVKNQRMLSSQKYSKQSSSNAIQKSIDFKKSQDISLDLKLGMEDTKIKDIIQKDYDIRQQTFSNIFTGMKVDMEDKKAPEYSEVQQTAKEIRNSMKLMKTYNNKNINKINIFSGKPLELFDAVAESEPDTVWNELNKRELHILNSPAPENPFEEMIRWTEKGRLWPFPIDNDYGLTEEANVGFHEHVLFKQS
ncbi:EEF1A lysine methyltransferase 1 [Nymphon striatum]|nr:EEF1A lysine methyltransferase 1 [Nymphon striatum]